METDGWTEDDRYSSNREGRIATILHNVSRNRLSGREFNRWETPLGKSSFPPFPSVESFIAA